MLVEIWSDVMCPFCYIGKRRFEEALAKFPHKEEVEVQWKSFQLQPDAQYVPGKDLVTAIAEKKGISREQMENANNQIAKMGSDAGIMFNFADAKIANTFDAHRLVKLAGQYGKANEAEELLFSAFFTEGKVVSDPDVLKGVAGSLEMDSNEIADALQGDNFKAQVIEDIQQAAEIGISGVPFFVFDRKYAVSGAQPISAFTQTLEAAYNELVKGR